MARHAAKTNILVSTSAEVALTGVTPDAGAAIFVSATSAAPDSDWDRLVRCESDGNRHIDTGNGYHGGLQFSTGAQNAFGGNKFTSIADQVSHEKQIYVTEKVLAQQGQDAWSAYSASLGLFSGSTDRLHPSQDAAPVRAQAAPAAAVSDSKTDLTQQSAGRLFNVDNLFDARALIVGSHALTGQVELPQELVAAIPFDLLKLQGLI